MKQLLTLAAAALAVTGFGYVVETNETTRTYTINAPGENNPSVKIAFHDLNGQPWKVALGPNFTGSAYLVPSERSTFSGGLEIEGQVRATANGIGTGLITLHKSASLLPCDYDDAALTLELANTVVFGGSGAYATSISPRTLHLHAIQATNTTREVRFGRTGTGESKVWLALDGASNGPVGFFGLQGALDLTLNGGTIRIDEGASGDIFRLVTDQATPTISTTNTTTFAIGANADVALGQDIAFAPGVTTNFLVHASAETPSYGFENGMAGWTVGWLPNRQHSDGVSGIQKNGSGFIPSRYPEYYTTNGSSFMMMRREAYLESTSVTVPSEGDWSVVFDLGCRPDDMAYSVGIDVTVLVDGAQVAVFPGGRANEPFKRYATPYVHLTAGTHTVRFETGYTTKSWDNIFFDCIRLEQFEETYDECHLRKTGAGTLEVSAYSEDDLYEVAEGALRVHPAKSGAARYAVKSGATLILDDRENLVVNGSFEQGSTSLDVVHGAATGWTRGITQGGAKADGNANGAGVQGNGGNVSKTRPTTPAGTYTAALRQYTYVEQTVTVPEAGTYRLSFLQGCRTGYSSCSLALVASVGGQTAVSTGPFSSDYGYDRFSGLVTLEAGEQTLRFEVTNGDLTVNGSMVFVDDVRLERTYGGEVTVKADLTPGATLQLDCDSDYRLLDLTVDSVPATSRLQLEAKGVLVTGTGIGRIRIGPKSGAVIILR